MKKYHDEVGTLGVSSFLLITDTILVKNNTEKNFARLPDKKKSGGFASPRTWDHFIIEARRAVKDYGNHAFGNVMIDNCAVSLLGPEVGGDVSKYIESYRKVLSNAKDKLKNAKNNNKMEGRSFFGSDSEDSMKKMEDTEAFQYAFAYAELTTAYIIRDIKKGRNEKEAFKEAVEQYGIVMKDIKHEMLEESIKYFSNTLTVNLEQLKNNTSNTLSDIYIDITENAFNSHSSKGSIVDFLKSPKES